MKIDKTMLKTLWYEDENGNEIPEADVQNLVEPPNAAFQVSRFPLEVRETHLRLIKQEDVDKCHHPLKYRKRTGGWIKGIKGRECQRCRGTQIRKWWQPWGFKWKGYGSREVFVGCCHIGGDGSLLLAMANSGDYTLAEAILAYSMACERCMNVLWHKYTDGKEGYAERSEEWEKCGTSCQWCAQEATQAGEGERDG
jgi:hypothetical protein